MQGSAATFRRRARTAPAGPKAILALLLALSALLVSVAMSSPALAWLGWISLLPLFGAIRVLPAKFAALAGAWWGAALALGHTWFAGAGGSSVILGIGLTVCVMSLYTGLGAALTRRIGFSPVVLAVGWIGVELALLPLGWRHGLLAATQSDTSLAHWLGPLLGYLFVAFLVAGINASLLVVASKARLSAPPRKSFQGRSNAAPCPAPTSRSTGRTR